MTTEEIIAANPALSFRHQSIGGQDGLVASNSMGVETWFLWKGDFMVSAEGPWTPDQTKEAQRNLRCMQPGREFSTVGTDDYARAMRFAGFRVIRGEDGEPHVIFGQEQDA